MYINGRTAIMRDIFSHGANKWYIENRAALIKGANFPNLFIRGKRNPLKYISSVNGSRNPLKIKFNIIVKGSKLPIFDA